LVQKLSPWGSGKATECKLIHICLIGFNNLESSSRLGHLLLDKNIWNINKMINLIQRKGGSSIEPMRFWHIKENWGKFEFKVKVGNSNLKKTQLTQRGCNSMPSWNITPLVIFHTTRLQKTNWDIGKDHMIEFHKFVQIFYITWIHNHYFYWGKQSN